MIIEAVCMGCFLHYSPGLDTCPRCGHIQGYVPDQNLVMKVCDGYLGRDCGKRILWPEDDDIVLCPECSTALVAEVMAGAG